MPVFFKVLSFLPLWLLHGVGSVLGWLAFIGSAIYRHRFVANVQQAGLARAHWLPAVGAAGRLVAELPRLWLGHPVRVHWDGEQHVQAALQSDKGIVCLTPHVGCFEITAQAYAQRFGIHGRPMTVLFRPPRQAWLAKLVGAARARPGLLTAPTTLAGSGPDLYRYVPFVLDHPTDLRVRAMQLLPSNRKLVHHAIIAYCPSEDIRQMDPAILQENYGLVAGDSAPG